MINQGFIKIGHRGACGYEPENTLRSFEKAIELGVDMVELDVYVCISGELVVIHDDKVNRTTNGRGYVIKKSFQKLRNLDAGRGEKIPLLEEVLDLIDKRTGVNIELKGANTAQPVAKIIKKYVKDKGWSYNSFLVSSFNHHELSSFNKLLPQIKVGVLIAKLPVVYGELFEKFNIFSLNISTEFASKEFVDDAHQKGLKVYVYTVNKENDIQKLKAWGVDGIYSNFPDRL